MPDVIEATDIAPVDLTPIHDQFATVKDELTELRGLIGPMPTTGRHPLAEFASLGDYAAAVYRGDADPGLLSLTIVDQITSDNPGVLPPSWATDVKGVVNLGRPAVSAFGVDSAGASGMDFAWPFFDGDLSALVGKQATQKTDITSVKVSIKKGTASLDTYAGGSDISYQLLQRSSPSYLTAYLRIMASSYAVVTDKAFGAALVTAATAQTGYDFSADTDGSKLSAALFEASVAVESATGQPAGFALVASNVFAKIGGMTNIINPAYGPWNASGVASARSLSVQVNGLPVIHDRGLADGTILVSNATAASWIEDGPRIADAEVPTRLGRDVAVYGYGTTAVYVPTGVIKVVHTATP